MNEYEKLQMEACRDGIDVIDYPFRNERIKGLYCDGTVAIRSDMNDTEKNCILAEELGHHYTSSGDITDQSSISNRKQEGRARLWAYNKSIGLLGLIRAYEHGCTSRFEIADFLDVTEPFLEDCIQKYKSKYGICTTLDNYTVYFEPVLMIGKRTE